MVDLQRKAMVLVQKPGDVRRWKRRGLVHLNANGLRVLIGRKQMPWVNLERGDIVAAALVKVLSGKASRYTPFRGVVLRLETEKSGDEAVVGITLPTDEAERWLAAANALIDR